MRGSQLYDGIYDIVVAHDLFIGLSLSLSLVRLRNLSDRVRNPTGTFSIRFLKFRQIRRISCCYRLLLLAFQSIYRCSTCAYYRDVVGGSFSDSYNRAVYFPPRMHRGRRDRWCLFLSAPSTYGFNTQYQRVCVFEMTKRSGDLFVRSSSKVFFGWENFFFLTLRETQNHQMTNTRTRNAPVCPVINQSGQCEGREIHKLDPLGPSHHLICIEQMKPSKQALYYYTSTTKFGK